MEDLLWEISHCTSLPFCLVLEGLIVILDGQIPFSAPYRLGFKARWILPLRLWKVLNVIRGSPIFTYLFFKPRMTLVSWKAGASGSSSWKLYTVTSSEKGAPSMTGHRSWSGHCAQVTEGTRTPLQGLRDMWVSSFHTPSGRRVECGKGELHLHGASPGRPLWSASVLWTER